MVPLLALDVSQAIQHFGGPMPIADFAQHGQRLFKSTARKREISAGASDDSEIEKRESGVPLVVDAPVKLQGLVESSLCLQVSGLLDRNAADIVQCRRNSFGIVELSEEHKGFAMERIRCRIIALTLRKYACHVQSPSAIFFC